MDTPTQLNQPAGLTKKHVRIWIWRGMVFLVGLVPVTGSITFITDGGAYGTSTSSFLGYLCMANSAITGCIDIFTVNEKTRALSRRVFTWTSWVLVSIVAASLIIPTI